MCVLTSLVMERHWESWEWREVSSPSRWSSWPLRQVSTRDRKGWWWEREGEGGWRGGGVRDDSLLRPLGVLPPLPPQLPLSSTWPAQKNFLILSHLFCKPHFFNKTISIIYLNKIINVMAILVKFFLFLWERQNELRWLQKNHTCNFQNSSLDSTG